MRRFPIQYIQPSSGTPAFFVLGGEAALADFTPIFHGKGWISPSEVITPFYDPQPTGTRLLVATTFEVSDNPDGFNGRYTVYTPLNSTDTPSSEFSGGTKVYVNEVVSGTSHSYTGNAGGYVQHISTYLLTVYGESAKLVYEESVKSDRPVEVVGRLSTGWGEILLQNSINTVQCFAGPTAPVNPFQGQLWFDTSMNGVLKIKNFSGWEIVNESYFGKPPYRHTQSSAQTTWTITHNFGLPAPSIACCDFFVDTPSGVKPIIPNDVTFTTNSVTVTFSNPYTGYVIVRP